MPDSTPRLGLPLLAAGQAQKEIYHNEALVLLDGLAQPAAESADIDAPPVDAPDGACWIVGPRPTGGWLGHGREIAIRSAGGWRFVVPRTGMALWLADRAMIARYSSGSWKIGVAAAAELRIDGVKVVGEQAAAIAAPSGGTTVDAEARAALGAVLVMLRSHGLIAG